MDEERWCQLQDLLHAGWALPPEDRGAYLESSCGDPELRREAAALLAVAPEAENYFQRLSGGVGGHRTESDGAIDLCGRRVGSYRLIAPLGRGGMGVVYLGERADGAFEQQVAVKLLAAGLAGPEGYRRFVSERRILAELEHPAIARLLDGGVLDDGTPYFVMERVPGERIDTWCDSRRLGIRERIELLRRVCEAVDYAHRKLVVHRDLKPANVLVTDEGDPKLLDFGVAKLLSGADPEVTLAPAAAPLTPVWAAPEQLEGGPITTATDTYSLGALAYLLLSGVRPHDRPGSTPRRGRELTPPEATRRLRSAPSAASRRLAALEEVDQEEIARARGTSAAELRRTLSGDLDAILLSALDPDPERRYGSAVALAADLTSYLEARPVSARAPSAGYRLGRFLVRRRVGVAAAAVIGVLLTSLVVVSVRAALSSHRQALQVAAERDRAAEVTAFLKGLFDQAAPDVARGRVSTARELLDHGAHQIRGAFDDSPELRAEMLVLLGELYQQLGVYDVARPLLEEGMALTRGGDELATHVKALQALGALDREIGHYARSLATLDRAERRLAAAGQVPGERHGELLLQLVTTLGHTGKRPEAVARARAALAVARTDPELPATARFDYLSSLGVALFNVGELEAAESRFQAAIALDVEGADAPSRRWNIHRIMGLMLWRQGDLTGSLEHNRQALALAEQSYPPRHYRRAVALNNLAWSLTALGRLAEAEEMLDQTAAIYDSIYPGDLYSRAYDLHTVRGINLMHGERFADAEPQLAAARDIAADLFGRDDTRFPIALANLGIALTELGRHREAADLLGESLTLHIRQLGRDSYRVGSVHADLAKLRLAQDQAARALEHADLALAVYRRDNWENPGSRIHALGLRAQALDRLGRQSESRAAFAEAIALGEAAGDNAGVEWPPLLAAYAASAVERGLPQAPDIVTRAGEAYRRVLGPAHPGTRRVEALRAKLEAPPTAANSRDPEGGTQ